MNNIGFGLWMTVMGMGTVFGMLALLMGLLALMGRLDRKKVPALAASVMPEVDGEDPGLDRMTGDGGMILPPDVIPATSGSPDDGGDPAFGRMTTEGRMTGMTPSGPTPELVAAITTAVLTHVRVRRGQAAPEMRQAQPGSRLFASRWVMVGRSYQNKPWK